MANDESAGRPVTRPRDHLAGENDPELHPQGEDLDPRIQREAAIRLFASDLGDRNAVLASLRALREDLPRLEAICDLYEQRAQALPHRHRAIVLELSLARRLLQAHRDWINDVEREFSCGAHG